MPCELPPLDHRFQQNPCNEDQKILNAHEMFKFADEVIRRLNILSECFGGERIRFRLTEDLVLGEMAQGRILKMVEDGPAWIWELDDDFPDAIALWDDEQCPRFAGPSGYEGWAFPRFNEVDGEYTIESMDEMAEWIVYQLDEHLVGGSAVANVLSYSNGCDPGAQVDVYDPIGTHKQWHRFGCYGKAKWNRDEQRYDIVDPQLVVRRWQATLTEDICPEGMDPQPPGAALVDPYLQDKYSALLYELDEDEESPTFGEWLEVAEVLIDNWIGKVGVTGKKAIIEGYYFHDDSEIDPEDDALKWQLEIVELIPVEPVVEFSWSSETCNFSAVTETIYVEGCGEQGGIPDLIPFQTVALPTEIYLDDDVDEEPESCRIKADFYNFCALPTTFAGTSNVAIFQKQEVMEELYLEHTPGDPEDPDDYGTCYVRYDTVYIWVPCLEAGLTYTPITLAHHNIIDEFELISDMEAVPAECNLVAHTREGWTIICEPLEDQEGPDFDVIEFTEQYVIDTVYMDGLDLKQDAVKAFLPCFDEPEPEVIIEGTECEGALDGGEE